MLACPKNGIDIIIILIFSDLSVQFHQLTGWFVVSVKAGAPFSKNVNLLDFAFSSFQLLKH